jgi:hypothetical protein
MFWGENFLHAFAKECENKGFRRHSLKGYENKGVTKSTFRDYAKEYQNKGLKRFCPHCGAVLLVELEGSRRSLLKGSKAPPSRAKRGLARQVEDGHPPGARRQVRRRWKAVPANGSLARLALGSQEINGGGSIRSLFRFGNSLAQGLTSEGLPEKT